MTKAITDTVSGLCTPYRDKPFLWLLAASVLLGLAFEPVYSMLGNYLLDYYRFGTEFIGWQFALNAMLVVTLQIPFSHWGERWGARRQLLAGSLLLACGLGMLPLGTGVLFVCLSTVIWTLGEILFMPTLNVLVMQRAQAGKSGSTLGFLPCAGARACCFRRRLEASSMVILAGIVSGSLARLWRCWPYR